MCKEDSATWLSWCTTGVQGEIHELPARLDPRLGGVTNCKFRQQAFEMMHYYAKGPMPHPWSRYGVV